MFAVSDSQIFRVSGVNGISRRANAGNWGFKTYSLQVLGVNGLVPTAWRVLLTVSSSGTLGTFQPVLIHDTSNGDENGDYLSSGANLVHAYYMQVEVISVTLGPAIHGIQVDWSGAY